MANFGRRRIAVPGRKSILGRRVRGGPETEQPVAPEQVAFVLHDGLLDRKERLTLSAAMATAVAAVAVACCWPGWATIHAAVMLCGVAAAVYVTRRAVDPDDAGVLKREVVQPGPANSRSARQASRRAA